MKKKIPRFGIGGTTSGGAYGGLDTVNQGSSQIGKSLGLIEQGLTGEQSNSVGSAGGQQTPTQNLKNLGLNMKRGGIVKKVKKFAYGGGMGRPALGAPPYQDYFDPSNGGGGAYGGLNTVNQGSGQIGKSLGTIQSGLTGDGGGNTGPFYPIDEPADFYQTGGVKSSMKKGGSVSSASKRGDGIAQKGKTRGKMC